MHFAEFNVARNTQLPEETIVASFRTARALRRLLKRSGISIEHHLGCKDDQLIVSPAVFEYLADCLHNDRQQNAADRRSK